MMTRVTFLDTGPAGQGRGRRLFDMTAGDWGGVALVAVVSVLLSVLATLAFGARTWDLLGPAVAIPLIVSIPASAVLFRQRRAMADMNRQMLDLLQYDPLTGVLSRRFFLAAAEAERDRGGALLLIDADRFKAINDNYGHPAGDAVLVALAARFRSAAGDGVLIGRLGGEEFAAFAPGRDARSGAMLGEAMRQAARGQSVRGEGWDVTCSVSVGVALLTPGGALAEAIRAADEALYRAKALGRDRLCLAGEDDVGQAAAG
jgi:diguanylate cyclase (GGDEF)-like protein